MSKNRFRFALIINGAIKEWHVDFRAAEKAARYYENNMRYYGWADIYIMEVKYKNGEVLHG